MARRQIPDPRLEPFPKEVALSMLKESYDVMPELAGLNHEDARYVAWHDNLNRVLRRNYPEERLPLFF